MIQDRSKSPNVTKCLQIQLSLESEKECNVEKFQEIPETTKKSNTLEDAGIVDKQLMLKDPIIKNVSSSTKKLLFTTL